MKKMLFAVAVAAVVVAFAGNASADPGGFAPPTGAPGASAFGQIGGPGTLLGAGGLPPDRGPDRYGWNPVFKRFFRLGGSGGCGGPGCGGGPNYGAMGYGGGPAYNPNGGMPMQGTLAFPNHPFVRSPRDYFMLDMNK